MNKKVSELTEATQINDNDIIMILQNNENKRASISKLLPLQRANVTLNSTIQANTNYAIPLSYKVRKQWLGGILFRIKTREAE